MRESKFIEQNLNKWQNWESNLSKGNLAPEELEKAFVQLNDDLSYAQTHYKNRSVRIFLNNLLAPIYHKIQKSRSWSWKNIGAFFAIDVPHASYQARGFFLVSLCCVMMGIFTGYLGSRQDTRFMTTVLGPEYISITLENIKKGKPLNIYAMQPSDQMFISIFTNNFRVGILVFALGMFFCFGSMVLMFINGIVLGVFTFLMVSHGQTAQYVLTVYQHGTIEILGMIVEGGAGMMVGYGLLFPGTLSRFRSMREYALKAVKIFISCLPLILIAAIIESYITRYTEIHLAIRISVIVISLIYMVGYYLILPYRLNRKNKFDETDLNREPDKPVLFNSSSIYTTSTLFYLALTKYKKILFSIVCIAIFSATVLYTWSNFTYGKKIQTDFEYNSGAYQSISRNFNPYLEKNDLKTSLLYSFNNSWIPKYIFNTQKFFNAIPVSFLLLFLLFAVLNLFIHKPFIRTKGKPTSYLAIMNAFIASLLLNIILFFAGQVWYLVLAIIGPIVIAALAHAYHNNQIVFRSLRLGIHLFVSNFWRITGITLLCAFLHTYLVSAGHLFFRFIKNSIFGVFIEEKDLYHPDEVKMMIVLGFFMVVFTLSFYFIYLYLATFTFIERKDGLGMIEKIRNIKMRRSVYGVEAE